MLNIKQLDHITITVSDVDRSIRFYTEILGLTPRLEWPGEITMLSCGSTYVAIAHWNAGKKENSQPAITVDHFAFLVDRHTFEAAKDELPAKGVEIDHISDHGNCQSIYFRDPDNHLLELTCYEIKGEIGRMPRDL